ncbi:MAG: SRPBCC family protein, partial [Bacteroidaceae bacterium]|nr:SRPBCC family protein [Bacteroidaceae bacterium]
VGDICLKVIEREEPKCVKMEGQGTPIPLNLWIQVVPNGDDASAIRVTLRAELNFFIRQMVSKPLQQAADGIAEMLARIDYT